ncbi:ABC transporter ATP-binding protein [Paraburkholderia sp. IMGN_8]|uniref:ABC transporter ATP-binding protein n=1 Tax=Paraburkholderia sp. IMGN_8 TaxID=3136564 RepID=UPI0031017C5B
MLHDIDLSVEPGELVAILGPSGAGKSSLLRIVAGLVQPTRGLVQVDDEVVSGPRADVVFAFQDPCLLPWLTVERNVAFGLKFARQPRLSRLTRQSRETNALREVGLEHVRTWSPSQLSGGMAQRVALARCLAREPRSILLDEPFGALDEVTRGEMQQLLVKVVRHTGSTAILVTHDIDEALLVADRILLLGNDGTMVNQWNVDVPEPRATQIQALGELRIQILRALHSSMFRAA